jgi:tetratricopeptide (TPR) repeat protein
MRKALKDYQFGMGCQFCEWQMLGGQFDQVYATVFDNLPVSGEAPEWPQMMEFTLSNTCNLACVMCYGILSSTIRAHRERLPPLPQAYDDRFFEDLKEFLPHLRIAKFFGGEPFLGQENYRVWDMMRAEGIAIPCHITTNGTQFNSKVERVLDSFPVSISMSIDGATKATVESVRVNARFETLMEHLDRFQEYTRRRGTFMSLTYCLMRQNWQEFGDYLQFAEGRGLSVFLNTVIDPSHCSLYTLPPDALLKIATSMEAQDTDGRYSGLKINGRVWQSGLASLRKNASERQVDGARAVKDEVRQLRISSGQGLLDRTWKLVGEGKYEDALVEVAKIDVDHRDYFDGLVAKAHTLRRLQRFDAAEAPLSEAIELWQRSPKPFLERSCLRFQQARYSESLADAIRARSLLVGDRDPVEVYVADALCFAYAYNGLHVEALEAANRLVSLRGDALGFVHRGWIHGAGGRWREALADAEAAIAMTPDFAEAGQLKQRAMSALSPNNSPG